MNSSSGNKKKKKKNGGPRPPFNDLQTLFKEGTVSCVQSSGQPAC